MCEDLKMDYANLKEETKYNWNMAMNWQDSNLSEYFIGGFLVEFLL